MLGLEFSLTICVLFVLHQTSNANLISCRNSPCKNGATCLDQQGTVYAYRCTCVYGWNGQNCEIFSLTGSQPGSNLNYPYSQNNPAANNPYPFNNNPSGNFPYSNNQYNNNPYNNNPNFPYNQNSNMNNPNIPYNPNNPNVPYNPNNPYGFNNPYPAVTNMYGQVQTHHFHDQSPINRPGQYNPNQPYNRPGYGGGGGGGGGTYGSGGGYGGSYGGGYGAGGYGYVGPNIGCSSGPCMNNGICQAQGNMDYRCICRYGFSGGRCEHYYDPKGTLLGIVLGTVIPFVVICIIITIVVYCCCCRKKDSGL